MQAFDFVMDEDFGGTSVTVSHDRNGTFGRSQRERAILI